VLGEREVAGADGEQAQPGVGRRRRGRERRLEFGEGLPHDRVHDGRLVGEVPVDRRRRDPRPTGDRAQGDGVVRLVEQCHGRRHDLVAETGALASGVAGPGRHGSSLQVKTYSR
jgi:hypothetical protein